MRVIVIGPGFDLRATIRTAMDFGGLVVLDESFYGYGIEYKPGVDLEKNYGNVVDHLPVESHPIQLNPYKKLKEKRRQEKFRQNFHSRKI